jgi:hypothetical protein
MHRERLRAQGLRPVQIWVRMYERVHSSLRRASHPAL